MPLKYFYTGFVIFIMLLIVSCKNEHPVDEQNDKFPDHINHLGNVIDISPRIQKPDTIELIREVAFESNNDVFVDGYIVSLAIDRNGMVYIGTSRMGHAAIYAFNPDGSFNAEIGRYGRGPGEFESIKSMEINSGRLYVFCSSLQKISVFSLENFSHIRDVMIGWEKINKTDSIARKLRVDQLMVSNDERFIVRLQALAIYRKADERAVYYRRLSNEGTIMQENLLEEKRFKLYFHVNEGMDVPFPMPFTRSSLVAMAADGRFFTNWTDDFLIKIYNSNGNYDRALYYPLEKSVLSMRDFDLSRQRKMALDQYEMPDTWPAIHTIELDDEDRVWVATITDSDSTFQWYVLNLQGKLLARFHLPGRRMSRSVMSKPLVSIKNGYFYMQEKDLQKGIDRIVKYKIQFK